jgi:tRNA (guanine-N7-)-methyltransferase
MLQLQVQSLSALMLPQSLSPFRPLSSSSSSFSQAVVAEQQQKPQQLRSSQLVSLEYADLNLSYDLNLGHGRIRQHVNPFSPSFSTPAQVPDWNQVFAGPALPLMVDI